MRGLRIYLNQVSYELINVIIPLIPLSYLLHVLGVQSYGVVAFIIGLTDIFVLIFLGSMNLLAQLSLNNALYEDQKVPKIFWNVLFMRLMMLILGGLALSFLINWASGWNISYLQNQSTLKLSYLLMIGSFLDLSWYYLGTRQKTRPLLQAASMKIVFLMLILITVKTSNDAYRYLFLMGVIRIVGNGLMWFSLPRELFNEISLGSWRFLKTGLTSVTTILGVELFSLTGQLLVTLLKPYTLDWIGYYQAALQLNQVSIVVVVTVGLSTMPRFYQIYRENNYNKLIEHIDNAVEYVTAFAVPVMFGTAATAVTFTTWFLGGTFKDVGLLMTVLSPLILLLGWNTILGGQFLRLAGKNNIVHATLVLGWLLNVLLGLLFIPKYGLFGAIYALLISEFLIFLIQLFYAREVIAFGRIVAITSKYLVTGLLMYLVIIVSTYNWPAYPSTTVFQLILGFVVYLIGIVLLRSPLITKAWLIIRAYTKVIRRRYNK